jgi:hypothetical protein
VIVNMHGRTTIKKKRSLKLAIVALVLGAFAKLQKGNIRFIMSACLLSVHPSPGPLSFRPSVRPHEKNRLPIGEFSCNLIFKYTYFEKPSRMFKVH